MSIPFWKMHGAGNDFILVDDRDLTFPVDERDWMARIASRRYGVGCDGFLLIQSSEKNDFRMAFFNPDGGEADMCGNGARCIARLAHDIGVAPEQMAFDTLAGTIRAHKMGGDQVLLHMTEPKDLSFDINLHIKSEDLLCHYVDTGVPHVVHVVEDVNSIDLQRLGAAIRYHERFAPAWYQRQLCTSHRRSVDPGSDIRTRSRSRNASLWNRHCGLGHHHRIGGIDPPTGRRRTEQRRHNHR